MKLFCVHVFAVLFIRHFCFSQFHQDDYDIVHDRIEVLNFNKEVTPTLTLFVFKYNETLKMKAINFTVDLKPGLRKNILLSVALLKNVQKIYRLFPVPNITVDLCEEYHNLGGKNPLGLQTAIRNSNFKGCPVAPGFYYINTWILEQEKFPPHIPAGEYKLMVQALIDDEIFVFDAAWYGSIISKKKKKKKH